MRRIGNLKKFLHPEFYYSVLRRDWCISTFISDFLLKTVAILVVSIDRFVKDASTISASALTFYSTLSFIPVVALILAIARGFGMEVKAIDPYCPVEVMADAGVGVAESVPALYGESDIVSIHIPATPETTGSIGRDLISRMPKGAVLINTARKEVIDEAGLAKALEERADLKYFADVKPDSADELIARFGNRVFFTPKKMGAQTAEANINAGIAAARQIVAFFKDGCECFRVNK